MYTSETTSKGEALINIDPRCLRPRQGRYGILWVGRIVVLLALLVQYFGTAVLWFRRAYRAYDVRLWAIDTRNFEMVCGGLIAALSSLAITILNKDWILRDNNDPESHTSIALQELSETPQSTDENRGQLANDNAGDLPRFPRPLLSPSLISRQLQSLVLTRGRVVMKLRKWLAWLDNIYFKLRVINLKFSDVILRYYDLEFQWDLELAYLLKVIFTLVLVPHDGFNRGLFWNTQEFFTINQIYNRFDDTFNHAGLGYYPYHTHFFLKLYLLPFIIISCHALLWLATCQKALKFIPRIFRKFMSEMDFWFRSGPTVFSILLTMLIFFPIYLDILFIRYDFEAIARAKSYLLSGMVSDRWSLGVFWKDPLLDQLYII